MQRSQESEHCHKEAVHTRIKTKIKHEIKAIAVQSSAVMEEITYLSRHRFLNRQQ